MLGKRYGDDTYAAEEFIAEMGAALLSMALASRRSREQITRRTSRTG